MSEVLEKESPLFTTVSVESVLLDADLFVKYRSVDKALACCKRQLNEVRVQSRSAKNCVK